MERKIEIMLFSKAHPHLYHSEADYLFNIFDSLPEFGARFVLYSCKFYRNDFVTAYVSGRVIRRLFDCLHFPRHLVNLPKILLINLKY